jgi:hypothetical protein
MKSPIVPIIATGAVTGLIGFTVGLGAGSPDAEVVTAEVAPHACVEALDAAEQVFGLSADLTGINAGLFASTIPDALDAAMYLDADGLATATAELTSAIDATDQINAELDAIDYNTPAAECRGQEG